MVRRTMHQEYGDGSIHEVCDNCGLCIECGDCKEYGCNSSKNEEAKNV